MIPPAVEYVYSFEELLPVPGYTSEHDLHGWTVANTRLARAGDYVWYDKNRNGIQDPGELPVAGVRVSIEGVNGTALPEGYDPVRYTDAAGLYLFSDLPPGDYAITFDETSLPVGFVPTISHAPGATTENDSNGLVSQITLTTEDDLTIDLGIVELPTSPAITKYVNESMHHLDISNGLDYTYNLIITLPNVIEEYQSFVITDTLDSRLELVSAAFARDKGQYFDVVTQGQEVRAAVRPGGFVPLGDYASVELIITARIRPSVTDQNIPNTATLTFTDFAGAEGRIQTPPVTVSPMRLKVVASAWKTLVGREMQAEDVFSFQLQDSQGQPVQTVSLTPPSGLVTFDDLYFDTAGTYVYTIRELPGTMDSVTYDDRVITLTISVAQDPDMPLALKVTPVYTSQDGQILPVAAFENTFHSTSLTATKRWENPTNAAEPTPRPDITLRLLRDGVRYGDWVTLSPPDLSYTWEGLPLYKADGSGELSEYRASEVAPPAHYQLSYDPDGTIINSYQPGAFSARKIWRNVPGASAVFQLYRTLADGAQAPGYPVPVGDPVTLTGAARLDDGVSDGEFVSWLYTWRGLPAKSTELPDYDPSAPLLNFAYEVKELDVPEGYALDPTASGSAYITNVNTTVKKTAEKSG